MTIRCVLSSQVTWQELEILANDASKAAQDGRAPTVYCQQRIASLLSSSDGSADYRDPAHAAGADQSHDRGSLVSSYTITINSVTTNLLTGFVYLWETFLFRNLTYPPNNVGFPENKQPEMVARYKDMYENSDQVLECLSLLLGVIVGSVVRLCPRKVLDWMDKVCGAPPDEVMVAMTRGEGTSDMSAGIDHDKDHERSALLSNYQFDMFICDDDWHNWCSFVTSFATPNETNCANLGSPSPNKEGDRKDVTGTVITPHLSLTPLESLSTAATSGPKPQQDLTESKGNNHPDTSTNEQSPQEPVKICLWNLLTWTDRPVALETIKSLLPTKTPDNVDANRGILSQWHEPVWTVIAQIFLSLGLSNDTFRAVSDTLTINNYEETNETLLSLIHVLVGDVLLLLPCPTCVNHLLTDDLDVQLIKEAEAALYNREPVDIWCRIYYEFHRQVNYRVQVLDKTHSWRRDARFRAIYMYSSLPPEDALGMLVDPNNACQNSKASIALQDARVNAVAADFSLAEFCDKVLRHLIHRPFAVIPEPQRDHGSPSGSDSSAASGSRGDENRLSKCSNGKCPHLALVR